MATWLIVVISVYSTLGALGAAIGCAFAREEMSCPWYLLPFVFVGFASLWPIALIDFCIDDAMGRDWPRGRR